MKIKTSWLLFSPVLIAYGGAFVVAGQQESLGDVARRLEAQKEQSARHLQTVEVYAGRLTFKAIPRFADSEEQLINRIAVQIRNSSPLGYRYAFTAKCGEWSKAVSGNIEGSVAPPKEKTISYDLPSACKWRDAGLEQVREAEGLEGPEPRPSKVAGIDDAELARQAKVETLVERAPTGLTLNNATAKAKKEEGLIAGCSPTVSLGSFGYHQSRG